MRVEPSWMDLVPFKRSSRELLSPFLCFRWADFQPMATFSSVPSVVLRVAYSQLWTRKGAVTTTQPFWNQDLGFRRRQWHPTPVLSPGKSHGQRSLVGCNPWGHDWAASLSLFTFMHWRRKWQPTPVLLPGESQGRGSLVGYRLWGRTESDTTEVT